MSKNDRKMAVLDCLRGCTGPVLMPQLMGKLGNDYIERTIRRWLADFVTQGLVEKTGQKRGTRYALVNKEAVAIDKVSNQQDNQQRLYSTAALTAIEQIKKPLFERIPTSYDFDWFDAYQPNQTFYLSKNQREQLEQAGQRYQSKEPAGTYARKIFNRLLIDLSFNSSRLEGNTYSLLETQRLLSQGLSAEGKLDMEHIMILNHKEAIRYMIDHARQLQPGFTEVCTLHFLLADALVLNQYAGKVRDQAVRIGGSAFMPIDNVDLLQSQLKRVCEKAGQINNPFEQSLFLLVHLAYLQPFIDVNKRTSRLSANIPLIDHNLVPLSFNDVENDDYTNAIISVYELKDTLPLAELFCFSYLRTCKQYDAAVESLGFDAFRIRYRQQRRELIRQIVVNKLSGAQIKDAITKYCNSNIPPEDAEAFEHSVMDDLKMLSLPRIVGMGISATDLNAWQQLQGN